MSNLFILVLSVWLTLKVETPEFYSTALGSLFSREIDVSSFDVLRSQG